MTADHTVHIIAKACKYDHYGNKSHFLPPLFLNDRIIIA